MTLRPCAMFHADFPDDQIEDDHDIIQFGGLGVAETIAEIVKGLGYSASNPQHEGEHGWTFEVRDRGCYIWFQITVCGNGEFLLISEQSYVFDKKIRTWIPFYADILTGINIALNHDNRFSGILWYLENELYAGFPGENGPFGSESTGAKVPYAIANDERLIDPTKSCQQFARVRPWANFQADFLNDQIEEGGQIIKYNGSGVTSAIGQFFERLGCFSTWPLPMREKGWRLVATLRGQKITCYVTTQADRQFRLFFKPPSWIRKNFSDDYKNYLWVITQVNLAMQSDPRFHDIRWHARPGRRSGESGAQAPVGEDLGGRMGR